MKYNSQSLYYYPGCFKPHDSKFYFIKCRVFTNFLKKILGTDLCFTYPDQQYRSNLDLMKANDFAMPLIMDGTNSIIEDVYKYDIKYSDYVTYNVILKDSFQTKVLNKYNIISFKYKRDIQNIKYMYSNDIPNIFTYHIQPIYLFNMKDFTSDLKIFNNKYNLYFHHRKFDIKDLKESALKIEKTINSLPLYDISYNNKITDTESFMSAISNSNYIITDDFDMWYLSRILQVKCYLHNKEDNIDYKNMIDIFGTDDINSNEFKEKLEFEKEKLSNYIKNYFCSDIILDKNYDIVYLDDKDDFYLNIDEIKSKCLDYPKYCVPPFVLKKKFEKQKTLGNVTILSVLFGKNDRFVDISKSTLKENLKNLEYLPKKWIFVECQEREEDFQLEEISKLHKCIKYIRIKYRTDFFIKSFLYKYALKFVKTKKLIYLDCDILFCNSDAIYNIDRKLNNNPFCYLAKFYVRTSQMYNNMKRIFCLQNEEPGYGFCINRNYQQFLDNNSFPINPFYPSGDSSSINDTIRGVTLSGQQKRASVIPNYILKNHGLKNFILPKQTLNVPNNIVAHIRHADILKYEGFCTLQEFWKNTKIQEVFPEYDGENFPQYIIPSYIESFKKANEISSIISEMYGNKPHVTSYLNYKIIQSYKEICQKYHGRPRKLNIILLLDNIGINYLNNCTRRTKLDDLIYKTYYLPLKQSIDCSFDFYLLTDIDTKFNKLSLDWNINKLYNILEVFKYNFEKDTDILVFTVRIKTDIPNIKIFKCEKNTINIRRYFNIKEKRYLFSDNIIYYNGHHPEVYNNYINSIKVSALDFYNTYDSPVSYINMYNIKNNIETKYIDRYFRIAKDMIGSCEFKEE